MAGTVHVSTLRTGEIHTDGGVPAGTPDPISGGVFVISGAVVDQVASTGPVTTYGQNDMVLDNWGQVGTWKATGPVVSRGPSGIGFVNFGTIEMLDVRAPVETFGPGARVQPLRSVAAARSCRGSRSARKTAMSHADKHATATMVVSCHAPSAEFG